MFDLSKSPDLSKNCTLSDTSLKSINYSKRQMNTLLSIPKMIGFEKTTSVIFNYCCTVRPENATSNWILPHDSWNFQVQELLESHLLLWLEFCSHSKLTQLYSACQQKNFLKWGSSWKLWVHSQFHHLKLPNILTRN